jgi:hypothetical protein
MKAHLGEPEEKKLKLELGNGRVCNGFHACLKGPT